MWIDINTIKESINNGVKFTFQSENIKINKNNGELDKNNTFIRIRLFKENNNERSLIISPIKQNLIKYLNKDKKFHNIDIKDIDENGLLSIAGETLNIIVAYISKKLNLSGEKTDISPPEYDLSINDISHTLKNKTIFNIFVDNILLFYFIL